MRWDGFKNQGCEEFLEEAMCLHMRLANERDHLDRILSQARSLEAVSLMHYG